MYTYNYRSIYTLTKLSDTQLYEYLYQNILTNIRVVKLFSLTDLTSSLFKFCYTTH